MLVFFVIMRSKPSVKVRNPHNQIVIKIHLQTPRSLIPTFQALATFQNTISAISELGPSQSYRTQMDCYQKGSTSSVHQNFVSKFAL